MARAKNGPVSRKTLEIATLTWVVMVIVGGLAIADGVGAINLPTWIFGIFLLVIAGLTTWLLSS